MPRPFDTTPLADLDLIEIGDFIAEDNPVAADHLIDRIVEVGTMLSQFPAAGRPREELGSGLRSFSFGNYLIFYRLLAERVTIDRVLNSKIDITRIDFS